MSDWMAEQASGWHWSYHDYQPEQEPLREALCTLGNGSFATRGAAPESTADDTHYPGTYLAGGYNRAKSEVKGRVIENEDLVNLPNWLPLRLRFADGDWFDLDQVELLDYRQTLAMRDGILLREMRVREPGGRETQLRQRRLVHMKDQHLAALETELTACNWSGSVEVVSALDGGVINDGVERYRGLENSHLEPLESESIDDDGIYLKVRTRQSRLEIALAARTRAYRGAYGSDHAGAHGGTHGTTHSGDQRIALDAHVEREPDQITQRFQLQLEPNQPVTIEKLIALFSSSDTAITECGQEARAAIGPLPRFQTLHENNAAHGANCVKLSSDGGLAFINQTLMLVGYRSTTRLAP
ncbi:MAG: hypothetical protein VBE63_11720 [Lamprobacter sp.]|uniref:hypothetical protein n=1 Tax=Lamprobacter sp. TaxID=3100796 RepID=UPI002B2642EC|nr:hypothetical protein [Lamprobacter sp.]MEA3640595.1 hypothetical protein [Lamprobacter sp.]